MTSKYQLAIEDSIDFPVNVDIQSGRVKKNFFFHIVARRMDIAEWRTIFGPDAENANLSTADFLRQRITGWRGQHLVLDEDGKPAEYSQDALDAMLRVTGLEGLLLVAYQKAVFVSDGDSGRRKNSAS